MTAITAADERHEPRLIRVTDTTTRAEIEEALAYLGKYAAHQLHHPDCGAWIRAHQRIDALLGDWERRA